MVTAQDIETARRARDAALGTDQQADRQRELAALVDQAKREWHSERAAIREYDGGMSRADAEAAAWDDVGGKP